MNNPPIASDPSIRLLIIHHLFLTKVVARSYCSEMHGRSKGFVARRGVLQQRQWMSKKWSAGVLFYRMRSGEIEVFLVHPIDSLISED